MQTSLLGVLSLALLGTATLVGNDVLNWPDCPPGMLYGDATDPRGAHFQSSPVAGPSGGTCSLDVVTSEVFDVGANSAGGVAFSTLGEVDNTTYTLAFDLQWVHSEVPWFFANESGGDGDTNGFTFSVPYPGDHCWHHYEYTALVGPGGSRQILFVYQGRTTRDPTPVLGEMRIDNMTLTEARGNARHGLVEVGCNNQCDGSDRDRER